MSKNAKALVEETIPQRMLERAESVLIRLRDLIQGFTPEDGQTRKRLREQILAALAGGDASVLEALLDSAERWLEAEGARLEALWARRRERAARGPSGVYAGSFFDGPEGIRGGADFLRDGGYAEDASEGDE